MKKKIFIDMDNVLVDFQSGIDRLTDDQKQEYIERYDEVPGIFSLMDPVPGSIESVTKLSEHFDLYILSTSPWKNPSAWSDKLLWIQKYFGTADNSLFYKRLILTHHKNLIAGDFLIDDRDKNGANEFKGELIPFGFGKFPDWKSVTEYLLKVS